MSQPVFTLEPSLDAAMFYSGSPAEPRCIGHLGAVRNSGRAGGRTLHMRIMMTFLRQNWTR